MRTVLLLLLAAWAGGAQMPVSTLMVDVTRDDPGYMLHMTNRSSRPITSIILGFPDGHHFAIHMPDSPLMPGATRIEQTKLEPTVRAVILNEGRVIGSAFNPDGSDFLADIFRDRERTAAHWQKWQEIGARGLDAFLAEADAIHIDRSKYDSESICKRLVDMSVQEIARQFHERLEQGSSKETEYAALTKLLAARLEHAVREAKRN